MKYSFFCKRCGDFFCSDDKEEVKKYRRQHPVGIKTVCPIHKTKRGTLARPKLAIMIDSDEV